MTFSLCIHTSVDKYIKLRRLIAYTVLVVLARYYSSLDFFSLEVSFFQKWFEEKMMCSKQIILWLWGSFRYKS